MNRFAANNPELFGDGSDPWDDVRAAADLKRKERKENPEAYEKVSNEPCQVCGEVVTAGGVPCKRCESNMEEDRMRREIGA